MNRKWLKAVVIATVVTLTAAGTVSAQNVYSDNFDAPGVVPGQSIFADPLIWNAIYWPAGADLRLGSGQHGWTGNYVDGSTAAGYEVYARGPWLLSLPSTGQSVLSFDAYAEGTANRGFFGFNGSADFDPIGTWSPYAGGWSFYANGYSASSADFDGGHDTTVTLKVYRDADTNQVWGSITFGGVTQTTAKYTNTRWPQNMLIAMDGRYGGIDLDNISLDVAPAILYGHVDLMDYSGIIADKALAPVKIELSQSGTIKFTKIVTLDSNSNYRIEIFTPGTYDVSFTACKWLKATVSSKVLSSGVETECNASLTNGDLDGDDAITTTDLSILLMNLQ